jgi:hypothetical protein
VRAKRLLSGAITVLVATAMFAGGVPAVPAHAQECPPENDTCEGRELEDFVDVFLSGQVNVTGPITAPDGSDRCVCRDCCQCTQQPGAGDKR